MTIWNDIENKLTKDFKHLFETTHGTLKASWKETLALFHQVFIHLLPEGDRLLQNLHTIWYETDDNKVKDDLESFVLGFENYVKLTLDYQNPIKHKELKNANKSFIHFLLPLHLLPRDKDKPHEIEKIMQKGYNVRNNFAHNKPNLRSSELSVAIEAVTVAFLYLTAKYYHILSKAVSVHKLTHLNSYLTKVETEFKKRQQGFVAIDGHELSYINSRAVERKVVLEADEVEKETVKSIEEWRDELKKDKKGKNRMIIWGGAGTGKSTTLFFLSYEDAKKKQANYQSLRLPIPVFLALNMQDDKASIEESIAKKLEVTEQDCTLLLQTGSLLLYLDGLNEITTVNNLRGRKEKQIKTAHGII